MRKRRRRRRDTAAYRDGMTLASLHTAEQTLLRMGSLRGLPEAEDVRTAIVALGRAIRKANERVDRRPA